MIRRGLEQTEKRGWQPKDTTFFHVYEAFLQHPLARTTSSFLHKEAVASHQRKPMQTYYYDERKRYVKSDVFGYGSLSDNNVSSFHRLDLTFPQPPPWVTKPGYERMPIGVAYSRIDAVPGENTIFIERLTLEEMKKHVAIARSFFPFEREAPPPSEEDIERTHIAIKPAVLALLGNDVPRTVENLNPLVVVYLHFSFDRREFELAFTALDEDKSGRSGIKIRNQVDGNLTLDLRCHLTYRPVATYELNLETTNFTPVFDILLAGVKVPDNPAKMV